MHDYSNVYIYLRIDSAYIQDIVGARLHVHLSISQGRLEVREGEILLFPTAFERSAAGVSQAARIVLRWNEIGLTYRSAGHLVVTSREVGGHKTNMDESKKGALKEVEKLEG